MLAYGEGQRDLVSRCWMPGPRVRHLGRHVVRSDLHYPDPEVLSQYEWASEVVWECVGEFLALDRHELSSDRSGVMVVTGNDLELRR